MTISRRRVYYMFRFNRNMFVEYRKQPLMMHLLFLVVPKVENKARGCLPLCSIGGAC